MISIIRKILSEQKKLYTISSHIYHRMRFLTQRLYYKSIRGVQVYNPMDLDKNLYKSQFGQDFLLDTVLIPNTIGGYFVEVGANDPVLNSNTHFFEKHRGFSGLSVDAIDFTEKYAEARPNTKFVNAVISSDKRIVEFKYVISDNGWEDQMSGINSVKLEGKNFRSYVKKVKTMRLEDLLDKRKVIDFLCIDVEGHEVEVLSGIDLEVIRPRVIICENSGRLSEHRKLQDYMASMRYELSARIWSADDVYVPILTEKMDNLFDK
jgi:FkbM family methyltransferase